MFSRIRQCNPDPVFLLRRPFFASFKYHWRPICPLTTNIVCHFAMAQNFTKLLHIFDVKFFTETKEETGVSGPETDWSASVPPAVTGHMTFGEKNPPFQLFHHRAAGGSWSVGIPTKWR